MNKNILLVMLMASTGCFAAEENDAKSIVQAGDASSDATCGCFGAVTRAWNGASEVLTFLANGLFYSETVTRVPVQINPPAYQATPTQAVESLSGAGKPESSESQATLIHRAGNLSPSETGSGSASSSSSSSSSTSSFVAVNPCFDAGDAPLDTKKDQ